jgi:hypothetical protein
MLPGSPISVTPQEPSGRSLVWTATKRSHTETAMHPIITRDLMKARITDLHRQAEREALALAACRARRAPIKQNAHFMPSHVIAELTLRMLTLLGARRPSPAP